MPSRGAKSSLVACHKGVPDGASVMVATSFTWFTVNGSVSLGDEGRGVVVPAQAVGDGQSWREHSTCPERTGSSSRRRGWTGTVRTHKCLGYGVGQNVRQAEEQVLNPIRLGVLVRTQASVIQPEL